MRPGDRRDMIRVKSLNLRLNRILLLAVGLWPYERSTLIRLQSILLHGIMTTSIVFQLTTFATSKLTSQFIIEVLSNVTFFITFTTKYNMFLFNMDAVKHLLELLQHIYDGLRDESEIAIIEKYGSIAKRYTDILTLFSTCGLFGFIFLQMWPCILDVVLPLNETRLDPTVQIRMEYFIDQEKYVYLIAIHTSVSICVGGTVMLATSTIPLACLHYACGMFEIASYRIQQATTINTLQNTTVEEENLMYKKMIYAVDIHRNATEFVFLKQRMYNVFEKGNKWDLLLSWFLKLLISSFNIYFLFLAVTIILSLSLNFFRIFQEMSSGCVIEKLLLPLTIVIVNYLYIFISNGCSQQVTDHNDDVFATVYNVQWYITPLPLQKMTLFLLQKGTKAFDVNIGGLIIASLENAATMTSASISYFTVLYSMRQ